MKESCIPFTAPHEADVVIAAKRAVSAGPKRTSFPSRFPAAASTPAAWWIGLPRLSAHAVTPAPARKRSPIAWKTAQPWRVFPVIDPSMYVSPVGIAKMRSISRRFVAGLGFS